MKEPVQLSEVTPETAYADIKQRVEKNLHEGWGVPYEVLILMARTLAKQELALLETQAKLADAQSRLPLEDKDQERRRLQELKAAEAALRVTDELVVYKRRMMGEFEHASADDMELLFGHAGQSYYEFEGQ